MAACLGCVGCATLLANQIRYVGNLAACTSGPGTQATLARVGDHFSFAPSDGALVVPGTVAPDGSFAGALVANPAARDRQAHAGQDAFTLTVKGRIDGDSAKGTYATPRCEAEFRLTRIAPSLLP